MRLLITLVRDYPLRSAVMLFALLLAGLLEGIGFSMLLPLLDLVVNKQPASHTVAHHAMNSGSNLERMLAGLFSALNITPTIGILLLIFIETIVLKSVLMFVAKKQVGYTVARVATDLRLALLHALIATRWMYYLNQPIGTLTNSMATEAGRASKAYLNAILMAAEFFQVVVYTILAFLVSFKATLIAMVAGSVIIFILKRFIRKARRAGIKQTDLLKSLLAFMTDRLQSIKPLKAMAREDLADFVLRKKTAGLNRALQKQVLNKELRRAFQEPLAMVFLSIGLYVMLEKLHMPLSSMLVLAFLISRLLSRLNKLQERYQLVAIFESAFWSMRDTIEEIERHKEPLLGDKVPSLQDGIFLKNISFAYDDKEVLKDVSLEIPAGKITTIVGPSGAGKTTIIDLVTGLIRPQKGEVWIDNLPLAQIDLIVWRRMIGYVPQDFLLLNDTVLTNVTLGDQDLSDADVIDALKAAGAWDFVQALPSGLRTTVGEHGGKLSGGQRQRIAIARALVNKPRLLILDEATTGLDPKTEKAICNTLKNLRGRLTILTVSHQPALLEIADVAYRVEKGRVYKLKDVRSENIMSSMNR